MIVRFWTQPCRAYRNQQIAFLILTLNFLIPATSYLVAPHIAVDQIHTFSATVGAPAYEATEDSHMWRFLAVADVMTLGFLCLLLLLNVRRWRPVLLPLCFLKGSCVVAAAYIGLFQYRHAFFWLPVLLDSVTVLAMWFFTTRAMRQLVFFRDDELVPRPSFATMDGQPMHWTAMERRWLVAIAEAMFPESAPAGEEEGAEPEGRALERQLEELRRGLPGLQRLGLRFAVALVVALGPRAVGSWRPFNRQPVEQRGRALAALGASDRFVVREMAVLLKMMVAMARELDPAFREGLGWGRGEPVQVKEGVPWAS